MTHPGITPPNYPETNHGLQEIVIGVPPEYAASLAMCVGDFAIKNGADVVMRSLLQQHPKSADVSRQEDEVEDEVDGDNTVTAPAAYELPWKTEKAKLPEARRLTLDEFLESTVMRHGDTIVGLSTRDYDKIERAICARLQPSADQNVLMKGLKFYADKLDDLLRPEKSRGSLQNGVVTLLDGRYGASEEEARDRPAHPIHSDSVKLLIATDLKSTGQPAVAVTRDVTYTKTEMRSSGQVGATNGGVRRIMGTASAIRPLEQQMVDVDRQSIRTAHAVIAHALFSPTSAGLPTSGKR